MRVKGLTAEHKASENNTETVKLTDTKLIKEKKFEVFQNSNLR